jgi:ribosome-associated protein
LDDDNEYEQLPPSKSQRKRDAHSLLELGAALLDLSDHERSELALPDDLVAALDEASHIRSHGARKRQLKFIGKLMRDIDPEPIRDDFELKRLDARRQAARQHELEDWRERMIEEGDSAVEAYLADHPDADRQHLRQLLRQARKELSAGKPPKSSRALFRYLRDSD